MPRVMMIAERMRVPDGSDSGRVTVVKLRFPPSELAVRVALLRWRQWMRAAAACPDLTGRAETVLAEVLNNIAEHGAADGVAGWVELHCVLIETGLRVVITDQGRPIPRHLLLPPVVTGPAPADLGLAELPEGGFGWMLIRELTRNLTCESDSLGNRLGFLVPRSANDG